MYEVTNIGDTRMLEELRNSYDEDYCKRSDTWVKKVTSETAEKIALGVINNVKMKEKEIFERYVREHGLRVVDK